MTTLAKIGFSQSYTYFTWKNTKYELAEFLHQQLEWSPTTGPTSSRTRPTSSTSTCSTAAAAPSS